MTSTFCTFVFQWYCSQIAEHSVDQQWTLPSLPGIELREDFPAALIDVICPTVEIRTIKRPTWFEWARYRRV